MKKSTTFPIFIILLLSLNCFFSLFNPYLQNLEPEDEMNVNYKDHDKFKILREKPIFDLLNLPTEYLNTIEKNDSEDDDGDDGEDNDDDGNDGSDDGEGEESDDDGDGVDDETEYLNERTIEVEYSDDEAQIESKLRQGENRDKIEIKMNVEDEGFKIKVDYSKDENQAIYDLEFEILILKLIEFIDNDNDSIFTEDQDTLLHEIFLDSFNDFQYTTYSIENSSNMHYFKISSVDGNIIFHIFFVEEYYDLNNSLLIPTQMKLDIEIPNYKYSDNSSQLGLVIDMQSESEYDKDEKTEDESKGYSKDEEWLQTSSANISGFFSWTELTLVDNIEKNVSVNIIPQSNEDIQRIYLIYPRGERIYHDPKIGIKGILRSPVTSLPIQTFNGLPYIFYFILAILLLFSLIMTKQEYRHYLLNRVLDIDKGVHRLTMEEVLENEFRNQILNLIIENPGIHYSEILRAVDTTSSNLAWHLDILETYKIISKKRVGRFLIFYPYIENNPFANFDINLAKSKTTLDIFQIIGDNPGIYQYQIAKRMDLNRKTVKYHLDKLESSKLIKIERIGRKNHIYPVQ
ncbi:MAG: winged helix-turn-helix transcriptional regulator [Promethearchaeota archaeon]